MKAYIHLALVLSLSLLSFLCTAAARASSTTFHRGNGARCHSNYICRAHNGSRGGVVREGERETAKPRARKRGKGVEKGWWVQPVSFPHSFAFNLRPSRSRSPVHSFILSYCCRCSIAAAAAAALAASSSSSGFLSPETRLAAVSHEISLKLDAECAPASPIIH